MPLSVGPLAPQPLQPRSALPLEPFADRPIALRSFPLDAGSLRTFHPFALCVLALEPLRDRSPAAAERDYLRIASAEATGGHRLTVRTSIGDAIVPREPHAARGLAASEAL
ncbi:MAG TPA: hypothetical protein VKA41_08390 [Solirubrobacterales bacterium]|nr:hypothetical protein [Solirubrobacterales bacterium]